MTVVAGTPTKKIVFLPGKNAQLKKRENVKQGQTTKRKAGSNG